MLPILQYITTKITNMKKLVIILIILTGLSLHSCKKKERNSEPTKTDLLTRENWTFVEIQIYMNENHMGTNTYGSTIDFKADGTFEEYFNGNHTGSGTWEFRANETKFYCQQLLGTSEWEIDTLTDGDFILILEYQDNNNNNWKQIAKFER